MRKYEFVEVKQQKLVSLSCDICGRDLIADESEHQESFNITHYCGYGSIFGDGSEVCVDICQHCFSKHLGQYCTVLESCQFSNGEDNERQAADQN